MMKVRDLKKYLEDLDPDLPVEIPSTESPEFLVHLERGALFVEYVDILPEIGEDEIVEQMALVIRSGE